MHWVNLFSPCLRPSLTFRFLRYLFWIHSKSGILLDERSCLEVPTRFGLHSVRCLALFDLRGPRKSQMAFEEGQSPRELRCPVHAETHTIASCSRAVLCACPDPDGGRVHAKSQAGQRYGEADKWCASPAPRRREQSFGPRILSQSCRANTLLDKNSTAFPQWSNKKSYDCCYSCYARAATLRSVSISRPLTRSELTSEQECFMLLLYSFLPGY